MCLQYEWLFWASPRVYCGDYCYLSFKICLVPEKIDLWIANLGELHGEDNCPVCRFWAKCYCRAGHTYFTLFMKEKSVAMGFSPQLGGLRAIAVSAVVIRNRLVGASRSPPCKFLQASQNNSWPHLWFPWVTQWQLLPRKGRIHFLFPELNVARPMFISLWFSSLWIR